MSRDREEDVTPSRRFRELALMAFLALVYALAGKLGLTLAAVNPSATVVWPPTGIALAAILLTGYRVWPGILAGAFLANITTAGTVGTSLAIGVGNTLEGLLGAYLVNRFAGGCHAFDRAQDVFKFSILAGLISTVVSATVGVTSLSVGGFAPWTSYGTIWLTWWAGDAVSALVVTPLLILWWRSPHVRWTRSQAAEGIPLLLSLIVIGQVIFSEIVSSDVNVYPLTFLCVPLLIWAAFRFGQREAATAIVILSGIAIWDTLPSYSSLLSSPFSESLLILQLFMGVMAVTTITLAAVVSERRRAEAALRSARMELEQRVEQRTEALSSANDVLRVEIAQRKRTEEALAEQAIRDPLTNLYNRRYFNSRIQDEIARADRNEHALAILLCDLDHFKAINDTRGHQAGDEVLKAAANAIQAKTRGTDLAFRWGGDEIVVVLSDVAREGVLIAADRILKGVRAIARTLDCDVDLSIGIALYPEHGRSADELVRLADRALYIAKMGGDKIHIGAEEYRLGEQTIKVVFQPVVDTRSNEVCGHEALCRDPLGKLSPPELFKRYQAIGRLNDLKTLCYNTQIKEAREAGLQRVFVNVDFAVLGQLELAPPPDGIEVILEISEKEALHDIENHLKITRQWRQAGYQFAIDDFGAGFISLPFIARLIPDYIKLDRSTVLHAVSSETFRTFSQDLVRALGNYASKGIIAEGIETLKELQVIREMGIHLAQGFLLGKPQALNRSGIANKERDRAA